MGALSPMHWLIAIGVLVVLFGAKRLPDAARSLGRSARILKAEVKDMSESGGEGSGDDTAAAPQRPKPAIPTAVPAPTSEPAPHHVPAGAAGPDSTR